MVYDCAAHCNTIVKLVLCLVVSRVLVALQRAPAVRGVSPHSSINTL